MVCLGVVFGCKRSRSVKDYVLSDLVIIAILFGFRILCYMVYRLLKRKDIDLGGGDENLNDGLELQPQNDNHEHGICLRRGLPGTRFVYISWRRS
ncbi:hypothetical protein CRYUN_Cryun32bG0091100 [Craigia yunnanensis]